jgi:dephospho-CoA kinase
MYKLGLTGSICSGKSVVLQIFKELGCYTCRADDVAKEIIFSPNSVVIEDIIKVFGADIYDSKTGIKKDDFTKILFADAEKRQFINSIVHPLVAAERKKLIANLEITNTYQYFIYESALLVESNIYKEFDKIIVVYSTQEEQINRLIERDKLDLEAAEKRIKAQFPLNEKLKVAHYTIDTSGNFENTRKKTYEAFSLIKNDLKSD